jgi:hypothetical protein
MTYLEKLKTKISPLEALPKLPKGIETKNMPTPPTANTAKSSFDSFDSDRGRRFSEKQDPDTGLKIESMTECLHGKPCRHLQAPGGDSRPTCKRSGKPIFDMRKCPAGFWFMA